ncbi:Holliday junction branch migration protein RuvA [Neisseria sp. Ec49-e6-T10]|uniref:Holliday junction branch migration protein RuvA n=1 Tax=Neisseria sp. Ec49-e6-T10 TaxID=3140744 RepID=UPI003EB9AFE5
MISKITGKLIEKMPPQIVIDVQGIGYEVDVSMNTFYALPNLGENVSLVTQLIIREDAHLLFGFGSKEERTTFRQLIKVSGIGAKTALGILSALTSEELASTIAAEDIKRLSSVPGIGKKTAERLILELRGKLNSTEQGLFHSANTPNVQTHQDIISALVSLGYSEKEANNAVKPLSAELDVGEGVRLALKNMLKK